MTMFDANVVIPVESATTRRLPGTEGHLRRVPMHFIHRLRVHCARLSHLAHHGEHALHVAYLGGVAVGGGYQYAAIGMLVCMAVSAFAAKE